MDLCYICAKNVYIEVARLRMYNIGYTEMCSMQDPQRAIASKSARAVGS